MKILFIQPKLKIKKSVLNKALQLIEADQFYYLHLSVYYLAAITPLEHSIKIVDERFRNINMNENSKLVVITCSTPFASRAYEVADIFRKKGKIVVLGGQHPSLVPHEAKQHADSVIIGEVDISWPSLLKDLEKDELKTFYKNEKPVDPEKIKKIRTDIGNKFLPARVEASRGCPNCCSFCLVPIIEGTKHRLRPIEDVVEEIKSTRNKFINFDDPSLTTDLDYTKRLFREMKTLNKKIFCCGNVNVLSKDDELLKLANDAGCIAWFVGFESFSQETLQAVGKKTNNVEEYVSVVEKLHENRMAVIGSFMFGFDTDKPDVFDKTLDAVNKLGLDSVDFNILGVYPGTLLFDRLGNDGRILTRDWSKYNFGEVVFYPKRMSKEDLEKGTWRIAMEFFSFKNIFKKSLFTAKLGFYPFIVIMLKNLVLRRFYKSWKTLY